MVADEQSSLGLQYWCRVIGSGAVINAGVALSFITEAFYPVV